MNIGDTLPTLLRLIDNEELAKYECMTPTTLDNLGDYRDGVDLQDYMIDRTANLDGTAPRICAFVVTV
jgi:hypothetical protein